MWNSNNPIAYSDPSGYSLEDACAIEGTAAAAAVAEGGLWLTAAVASAVGASKVSKWADNNRAKVNHAVTGLIGFSKKSIKQAIQSLQGQVK